VNPPFDEPSTQLFNAARGRYVSELLQELKPTGDYRTGLDVGCGFGYFAQCLSESGLTVTAFDGREENTVEAARRNPKVTFHVYNVEDPAVRELGRFDVVTCLGLLYHLENPFAAIRNVAALTGKVLILESVVAPFRQPAAVLYQEDEDIDQGLNYVALIPSESWLIKTLYLAGLEHVYRPVRLPDHSEFRGTAAKRRRRTMLVASRDPLRLTSLRPAAQPRIRKHIWDTVPVLESDRVRSAVKALRGRS